MNWRRWGLALMPVAAGVAIAPLVTQVPTLSNPVIYVHVDVGTAALITGLALSILAVTVPPQDLYCRTATRQEIAFPLPTSAVNCPCQNGTISSALMTVQRFHFMLTAS